MQSISNKISAIIVVIYYKLHTLNPEKIINFFFELQDFLLKSWSSWSKIFDKITNASPLVLCSLMIDITTITFNSFFTLIDMFFMWLDNHNSLFTSNTLNMGLHLQDTHVFPRITYGYDFFLNGNVDGLFTGLALLSWMS